MTLSVKFSVAALAISIMTAGFTAGWISGLDAPASKVRYVPTEGLLAQLESDVPAVSRHDAKRSRT